MSFANSFQAACIWVWIGREEVLLDKGRYTWIDRLTQNGFIFDPYSEYDLYIVSLYWGTLSLCDSTTNLVHLASTVSSSVGSGDIIPANPTEAAFVAFFQIMGGCMFAYSVSSLVGLYAAIHALEEGRGLCL